MKKEIFSIKQPRPDFEFPRTDLEIVETPSTEKIPVHPGIIIGPAPLDEENLPGSKPLKDDASLDKPNLNS